MYTRKSRYLYLFSLFEWIAMVTTGCAAGAPADDCADKEPVVCTCTDGRSGTRACQNGAYSSCVCDVSVTATGGSSASDTARSTVGQGGIQTHLSGIAGMPSSSGKSSAGGRGGAPSAKLTGGTAGTGGISGVSGSRSADAVTCPPPLACRTNDLVNLFATGLGPTIVAQFCAYADDSKSQMGGLMGPTPPECKTDSDCAALGLPVTCTSVGFTGAGTMMGCLRVSCK